MEKDTLPVEYKGKSLSEIDIDPSNEYAIECNVERIINNGEPSSNQVEGVANIITDEHTGKIKYQS